MKISHFFLSLFAGLTFSLSAFGDGPFSVGKFVKVKSDPGHTEQLGRIMQIVNETSSGDLGLTNGRFYRRYQLAHIVPLITVSRPWLTGPDTIIPKTHYLADLPNYYNNRSEALTHNRSLAYILHVADDGTALTENGDWIPARYLMPLVDQANRTSVAGNVLYSIDDEVIYLNRADNTFEHLRIQMIAANGLFCLVSLDHPQPASVQTCEWVSAQLVTRVVNSLHRPNARPFARFSLPSPIVEATPPTTGTSTTSAEQPANEGTASEEPQEVAAEPTTTP